MFKPVFSPVFSPVFGPILGFEPETNAFVIRVLADGGAVEDVGFINAFIIHAKSNGYFDDIVAAYSPSWGVKGTTTASKLYSITGAGQDLEQTTGSKQPTIDVGVQNGKTIIKTDGISQIIQGVFPYNGPETVALMGFRHILYTSTRVLIDGMSETASGALQHIGGTPFITQNVAGVSAAASNELPLDTAGHLRSLFNDPVSNGSKLQINNNAENTGDLTIAKNMSGFSFGGAAADSLWEKICVGGIVLLNSPVDADYGAKMAAIYAFSKEAYGTP